MYDTCSPFFPTRLPRRPHQRRHQLPQRAARRRDAHARTPTADQADGHIPLCAEPAERAERGAEVFARAGWAAESTRRGAGDGGRADGVCPGKRVFRMAAALWGG